MIFTSSYISLLNFTTIKLKLKVYILINYRIDYETIFIFYNSCLNIICLIKKLRKKKCIFWLIWMSLIEKKMKERSRMMVVGDFGEKWNKWGGFCLCCLIRLKAACLFHLYWYWCCSNCLQKPRYSGIVSSECLLLVYL